MLAGTLEKRIGERSGRQSLPEAWKWQKRYFVLSEPQGKLYYFKSADDPPNYKGLIDMRECKAEDVDVDGLPRNAAKSKYDLDGGGGQVSLLIRISHKVRCSLCLLLGGSRKTYVSAQCLAILCPASEVACTL